MNAIERIKLTKELLGLRTALQGEKSPLQRMKLSRQVLEVRAKLMGAQPAPAMEPTPEVQEPASVAQEGIKPHLDALLAVTQGQHDAEGLQALYERIKGAVEALEGMGALVGEGAQVSNEAITHWAELEVKQNG
jgi:hypothetical protein